MQHARIRGTTIGAGQPLALICGPCVVEERDVTLRTAEALAGLSSAHGLPLVFKASYEKDNRTQAGAHRGPGLRRGLEVLAEAAERFGLPLTTDVHRAEDVGPVAEVVDMIQVPAFLCRQTSLLEAVGRAGRAVNLKKGQFMTPEGMGGAVDKVASAGARHVLITERGSCWGPGRLVCDMPAVPALRGLGRPVAFDAGHASARREDIPVLARCGVAAGADALFLEAHPDPARARCDGERMLSLHELEALLPELVALARLVRRRG